MQTPKSRPGSLDVPQKPSPATPRTGRKLKTSGSDSDALSSPNPVIKTPKERSPKVVERRSPRSPAIEKKKPTRLSELEPKLAQLQEDLKQAKNQLSLSESSRKKVQHEAEEVKKQLAAMSAKLEETLNQLKELSDSEESRVQELRKISQDRDREWESELEAVRKQHSKDSSALASALNEIQRLKIQLDKVSESESSKARHAESAHNDVQSMRVELTKTLELVDELKNQLNESREAEAHALEEVARAQMLLEVFKTTEGTLMFEHATAVESYKSVLAELEYSKNRVNSLEELVHNLQAANTTKISSDEIMGVCENGDCGKSETLKKELDNLKREARELREALEAAEKGYQDQYIQSNMQIRNAYELVEHAKTESCHRATELEAKLKESRVEVDELKSKLIDKENQQNITEENKKLKAEIMKSEEAIALAEEAKAAEKETLSKLGYLAEEADKSCKKAARVAEELNATQAANSEMEAELRRLKVQSDQWRKAAEAAAAMLSNGNNGKYVERTGSLDYHTIGGKLGSPYYEDEDSPKKKNGNMLKKIGVLLRKGQK